MPFTGFWDRWRRRQLRQQRHRSAPSLGDAFRRRSSMGIAQVFLGLCRGPAVWARAHCWASASGEPLPLPSASALAPTTDDTEAGDDVWSDRRPDRPNPANVRACGA
jgi:hypothetical protein